MTGLFVALGIAILTLLAILLWFVPHLLQQHEIRVANETTQLREMISEMINEQEAVAMRQVQLSTSISYLQDQLEQLITIGSTETERGPHLLPTIDPEALQLLETRVYGLQHQIDSCVTLSHTSTTRDSEAWFHLLSLLAAIQDRLRVLSEEQRNSRNMPPERGNCNGHGRTLTGQHL